MHRKSRIRNTAFCMCADTSWSFEINSYYLVNFSVAASDPNPDPPDTHVFGPSRSGSISQWHGSADPDPDPHQNVMAPQHWLICYEIQAKNDVHYLQVFYLKNNFTVMNRIWWKLYMAKKYRDRPHLATRIVENLAPVLDIACQQSNQLYFDMQ